LEDWRDEDDKMFRGVWKTVKTKVEKIRIAKTEKKRKMEVKKVVEEWEI